MDVKTEARSHYLYVHFSGEYKGVIPEKGQILSIEEACQQHHVARMVMDIRELVGEFETMTRYWLGTSFADAFAGRPVRTAVVGNTKQVDTRPFFETVATNRGANVKVFTDFDAAVEWLME